MPLAIHTNSLRRKKRLLRYVQVGMGRKDIWGTSDLQSRESEDIRRRLDDIPEPARPEDPGGGGGGGGQPIIPPVVKPSPDREHFWSNHFVLVSNDHRQGEDLPVAPGYAPVGRASSLQAGYDKAVELVSKLTNGGRVVIILKGGYYSESVNFNNPRIDLEGEGSPMIIGNSRIDPLATKMKIRNITWVSENDTEALQVMQSPALPPFQIRQPELEFFDCEFVGTVRAFRSRRRFYASNTIFNVTDEADILSEVPTAEIDAWPEPIGQAVLEGCYFYGALHPTLNTVGVALKATAKVLAFTEQYGGYLVGDGSDSASDSLYLRHSGVILKDCFMSGGLLNEGWEVHHIGGWQRCGSYYPPAAGHVYCKNRGWWIMDPDLGATKKILAKTYWDNSANYSAAVAEAIFDPNYTEHYPVGGAMKFRGSLHFCKENTGTSTAFVNTSSYAEAYIVNSATAGPQWTTSAFTPAMIVNSPKGIDYPIETMRTIMADTLMHE